MWRLFKSLLILTTLIILACEKGEIIQAVDPIVELHAFHVTSKPVVDGRDDDDVWQQAEPFTIHVFENPEEGESLDLQSGFNVTLKAVWWEDWMLSQNEWIERPFISILLSWPDTDKNINKNVWNYNHQDSSWAFSDSGSDWVLFYWWGSSIYRDLWHWDAAVTNPMGYAEDQFVEVIEVDTTAYVSLFNIDGTNFLNDYGDYQNCWDLNYNDNLTPRDSTDDYPKMAWKFDTDSIAPSLPRIYSSDDDNLSFLLAQDADLIENTPYFHADRAVSIPGYILEEPIGPATDIVAVGRHENGYWTIELIRPAATNDLNDIGFVPSSRYSVYYFELLIGNKTKSPDKAGSKYFISGSGTSFTFEFIQ